MPDPIRKHLMAWGKGITKIFQSEKPQRARRIAFNASTSNNRSSRRPCLSTRNTFVAPCAAATVRISMPRALPDQIAVGSGPQQVARAVH